MSFLKNNKEWVMPIIMSIIFSGIVWTTKSTTVDATTAIKIENIEKTVELTKNQSVDTKLIEQRVKTVENALKKRYLLDDDIAQIKLIQRKSDDQQKRIEKFDFTIGTLGQEVKDLQIITGKSQEIMKQLIQTNKNVASAIRDLNKSTSSFEKVVIRLEGRVKNVESELHQKE